MGVKINPADMQVTQHDQKVALGLMDALMRTVGPASDSKTQETTAKDLHRVLALMCGMVLETDPTLLKLRDFRMGGEYLGEMIAMFAKMIRDERERTGVGMMDLVGPGEAYAPN